MAGSPTYAAWVPHSPRLTRPWSSTAVRVAEITATFWLIKGLSTALGESLSDYLVLAISPVVAVLLGFAGFVIALAIQLTRGRYRAWSYWLAVVMVGVFGTMAADVVHVALGVAYVVSSVGYSAVLAAVFVTWWLVEGTVSMHGVTTWRRELFYWAAVAATFATGTAVGDLTAITLHLGYAGSIVLFATAICIPAVGYRLFRWNPTASFWVAYVLTRPLGASIADWTGKSTAVGGLGWGDGLMSLSFALVIAVLVARLSLKEQADFVVASDLAVEE
jgi:uncharacterized membrane-anchored protein